MSTVALYCFFQLGMGRGARKHQKHFSNRLTLSIEFFKVPCRSSLLYTPLYFTQSFILLLVVLQSVKVLFTCLFFPVSSTSVSQALLSFTVVFRRFEAVFLSFSVNWCLSHLSSSSSSHKFNFCCYAPNLAFYNHGLRTRNEVQVR